MLIVISGIFVLSKIVISGFHCTSFLVFALNFCTICYNRLFVHKAIVMAETRQLLMNITSHERFPMHHEDGR